jgi:hypothetical protein
MHSVVVEKENFILSVQVYEKHVFFSSFFNIIVCGKYKQSDHLFRKTQKTHTHRTNVKTVSK